MTGQEPGPGTKAAPEPLSADRSLYSDQPQPHHFGEENEMGYIVIAAMLLVSGFVPDRVFAQSTAQRSVPADAGESLPASGSESSISGEKHVLGLSAQELRDKPVFDTKHERVATVMDVTGLPGSPRQAILQTGGVLGIGGNEVKLPLDKLELAPNGDLTLTMTESELRLLPRAN